MILGKEAQQLRDTSAMSTSVTGALRPFAKEDPLKLTNFSKSWLAMTTLKEYTILTVRRLVAALLSVTFSSSLMIPALSAYDADSKLPSCCRRNGEHHCELTGSQSRTESGPTAAGPRCPSFPTRVAPANRLVSAMRLTRAFSSTPLSHSAIHPQTQSLCRGCFSRARLKRGPPTLHS